MISLLSKSRLAIYPGFRRPEILQEQVKLLEANLFIGLVAFSIIASIAAFSVYAVLGTADIFGWLLLTLLIPVFGGRYVHRMAHSTISPEVKATRMALLLCALGLTWAVLPIGYLDISNANLTISITCITAGLVAGALTMQSPCLPIFLAFSHTVMGSLFLAFILNDTPLSLLLALACLVYLIVLNIFAFNLERMVKESIELRFYNLDLIEKLRNAMQAATEADRAKSVFLASASHDLRQPLHALGLFTQTLGNTSLDTYQRGVLAHIDAASESTRGLLDTLLNFSRLDAGAIEPAITSFQLQNLFLRLERELGVAAGQKQLRYRTRPTRAIVETDSKLLELILRNLISNAIRYTSAGGILVAARKRADHALIEVWDTGVGIAKTEQANIFKEFHQLKNPQQGRELGFGLGLAIVKGLCNTLKLSISVSSVVGKGSVFRLLAPLSKNALIEDLHYETVIENFNNQRVLIIDDDPAIRLGMSSLLKSWGCQCLAYQSAEEAIDALLENHQIPDLVITDYRLQDGKTGKDALLELRNRISHNLKAIIITGDTAPGRLREASSNNALLLHKPVSAQELYRSMASLLPTL